MDIFSSVFYYQLLIAYWKTGGKIKYHLKGICSIWGIFPQLSLKYTETLPIKFDTQTSVIPDTSYVFYDKFVSPLTLIPPQKINIKCFEYWELR